MARYLENAKINNPKLKVLRNVKEIKIVKENDFIYNILGLEKVREKFLTWG